MRASTPHEPPYRFPPTLLRDQRVPDSDADRVQRVGGGPDAKRQLAAVVGVLMATLMVVSLLALPNMKRAGPRGASKVPARELQNPDGSDRTYCRQSPERLRCPALDMFDDPYVHQKVTDNLIWSSHEFLGIEARGDISQVVEGSFGRIRAKLLEGAPKMAQHMMNLQLTASESTAGLSAMQLIVDDRVQSIGREVAVAMLSSLPEEEDYETSGGSLTIQQRDTVVAGLEEKLRPKLDEIRKIIDTTVPPPLRTLWGEGRPDLLPSLALSSWEMTLEPSVVATLRASSDQVIMVRRLQQNSTLSAPQRFMNSTLSTPPRALLQRNSTLPTPSRFMNSTLSAPPRVLLQRNSTLPALQLNSTLSAPPRSLLGEMTHTGRQEAILGATFMLRRTLLNAMQMYMRLTSNSMAPLNNTDVVTDGIPNVMCEVGDGTDHSSDHMEPNQAVICSLKFGIMGADALRAAFMGDQMTP